MGATTTTEGQSDQQGSLALWWRGRYGVRLLLEICLVVGLLTTYMRVRQWTRGDLRAAFRNTREVIHFERWIGLPFEDDLQRALLHHPELVRLLNHYYLWFHFPVAVGLLVWLYWRHNDHYFYTRRLMAVVTFAALVMHVAYPLAPPRMMPGFVDTMFRYGPSIYTRNTLEGAANQIAAMPSLHFGWAVIAAMAVVQVFKTRWRYLAVLHPILMATAILATANHWWVDAAAAGLIILLCWAVAKIVSRLLATREQQRWDDRAYTPVSTNAASSKISY
ncbi:MAG: phosphatase PAP2 family protein [Ilumatobacteraceae bacterium]